MTRLYIIQNQPEVATDFIANLSDERIYDFFIWKDFPDATVALEYMRKVQEEGFGAILIVAGKHN